LRNVSRGTVLRHARVPALGGLGPRKPAAPAYVEPEARVVTAPLAVGRPADFPTKGQLDSLLNYVLNVYPKLGAAADTRAYKDSFERAFLALCYLRRRPEIDRRYHMSYWRDYAQDVLSSLNVPSKLDLAPFVAATIAHGDIPYSSPFNEMNYSMSAGLIYGGGTAGKAYAGGGSECLKQGTCQSL
jgi:hypothetical protein